MMEKKGCACGDPIVTGLHGPDSCEPYVEEPDNMGQAERDVCNAAMRYCEVDLRANRIRQFESLLQVRIEMHAAVARREAEN